MYQEEANMINPNWTDSCHYIKEDMKTKEKDIKHDGQESMDMVFIGPDIDVVSSIRNGKIIYANFIYLSNILRNYLLY